MIVDCHTQVLDWASQIRLDGESSRSESGALRADRPELARHMEALLPVDLAFVLAFKSRYLNAEISNQYVAEYVRRYASKLIGFAGIDPTEPSCPDELAHAQEALGLKGVTISPSLQDFHPCDTRAQAVYRECVRRGMPVLVEQDLRTPAAKMEYARPLLFDEVARDFPALRIVVAHVGAPWVDETLYLLRKHENVFADVAGLSRQPWALYNALLRAYELGVMHKLLFGSDFPERSPAACIETLYSINQFAHGTNLTAIPREQLRGIVERDALKLLGIENRSFRAPRNGAPRLDEDE